MTRSQERSLPLCDQHLKRSFMGGVTKAVTRAGHRGTGPTKKMLSEKMSLSEKINCMMKLMFKKIHYLQIHWSFLNFSSIKLM